MSDKLDFRGKLLFDESYSRGSEFVEQLPINDLLPYLENAFDKGVLAIKWNQFVPGFNDGEPCEFTIHYVCFTSNPVVAEAWVGDKSLSYLDGLEEMYPHVKYIDEDECWAIGSWNVHPDGLTDEVDVPVGGAQFEYAVRAEFGDNVTVVITPESTYKFDYECGY